MSEAQQISVEEFLERRKANPKSVIIDVRDNDKWEEGHIPGAIHIHKTGIAEEIAKLIKDKKVEIFTHCGGGTSGPKAAALLNEMGYNAKAIRGGFRSYKASGEKIVK
jgi:rhodanese-related sulfurtransferase